ncbi:MAG: gliding motility-associated C-terminal domain-containing protein [Hyphomicrobiales bacterium]
MKKILILTFILSSFNVFSQGTDCDIVTDPTLEGKLCVNDSLTLRPNKFYDPSKYSFEWQPGGETTQQIVVKPTETTDYSLNIVDKTTSNVECNSSILIEIAAPIDLTLESIQKTCAFIGSFEETGVDESQPQYNNAILKVNTDNITDYTFTWFYKAGKNYKNLNDYDDKLHLDGPNGGSGVIRAFALSGKRDFAVKITKGDDMCEIKYAKTEILDIPKPKIIADPEEHVYRENPIARFKYENENADTPIDVWLWKFESEDNNIKDNTTREELNPQFIFSSLGKKTIQLFARATNGCDTTATLDYEVKPVNLKVPKYVIQGKKWEITPDNGGSNGGNNGGNNNNNTQSSFKTDENGDEIKDLNRYYERCKVRIFTRWGKVVYETSDYKNDWTASEIKPGVYFYIIECTGFTMDNTLKGSVTVFKR